MPCRCRRGETLIELIVALVLLEIIGAAALATALTAEHLSRRAAAGARDDTARWLLYRSTESAPACAGNPRPDTIILVMPATTVRDPLTTTVRCGP